MDDLIDNFFEVKYSPELRELLYRALGLFTVSGYTEPFGDIVDYISTLGYQEEVAIVDAVRMRIENGINSLLEANRINILPEVTFRERIRLVEGIFAITKVEDPSDYLPLFEGWLSNEEKFAKAIGLALGEPHEEFFVQLLWVYEGTVDHLKEYMESLKKELESPDIDMLRGIRKNMLAFSSAFGNPPIIEALHELDIAKGQPFRVYYTMMKDDLFSQEDMELNTYVLLWLALISNDGYQNPKMLLLEETKTIFEDFNNYQTFVSMLTKATGVFQNARKVYDEQV